MTREEFDRDLKALICGPSTSEFLEMAGYMSACLVAAANAVDEFQHELANELGRRYASKPVDESKKA